MPEAGGDMGRQGGIAEGAARDGDGGPWPWQAGYDPAKVLAPHGEREWHPIDARVNSALDDASARGDRGRNSTGVRAWHVFCHAMGQSPVRPMERNAPLWVQLEEEWLAMRFVCSLVEVKGIAAQTASNYFSQFQGWHHLEHGVKLAGGIALERLPKMVKGLKRQQGARPQKVRRGLAPHLLRKAMDLCLDPRNPVDANKRAALATAFQGLLRGAEVAVKTGTRWKESMHMSRSDVKRCDSVVLAMMIHPCKNMKHLSGKTCPLVIGAGGTHIDAAAEVANLLRVDGVGEARGASTPMFRDPRTGLALDTDGLQNLVRAMMQRIGEDPMEFGTHSLRIGGATALYAAGATPMVIRTMGRWSSDLYSLYVRASFEQAIAWSKRAGSTTVHDLAGVRDFDEVDSY